jgi:D-methionine transport system substrate-binding protein
MPQGGSLSIPNDPTNGGRVLLLLRDKGALKLKDGVGFKPTVADIVENTKNLKIVEIDAAQTPRTLDDVDAAAVNTNCAKSYQTPEIREFILTKFKGAVLPAW